jgi:hypothetical protein
MFTSIVPIFSVSCIIIELRAFVRLSPHGFTTFQKELGRDLLPPGVFDQAESESAVCSVPIRPENAGHVKSKVVHSPLKTTSEGKMPNFPRKYPQFPANYPFSTVVEK